jgi:hypothetical protein
MGLLTGGPNGRRFRITTPLPGDFRDQYLTAIRDVCFIEQDANDSEPRVGWVNIFDTASTTFELNDLLVDRYLCFTMRTDVKKVQGAYLKIALTKKIAAVCEEQGVEKLSKAEKEIVKEALETALFGRALPSVSTTDVCWDIHTGEVTVFATAEGTLENVRLLMRDTFGVRIHPERLCDWVADKVGWAELAQRTDTHLGGLSASIGNVVDGHQEGDPLERQAFSLSSDFLTWLWLRGEASEGVFRVLDVKEARAEALRKRGAESGSPPGQWDDVTESLRQSDLNLWIDSRLKLQELVDEDPSTTILMGASPAASPEARRNLSQGKRPVEARIGLSMNDLEIGLTLRASSGGLTGGTIKPPTVANQGREEKLLERAVLLDLVHVTLRQLFQQFFLARTSPDWDERVAEWMSDDA